MRFESKNKAYSLGIDVGTTGVRTAVIDHQRECISHARVTLEGIGKTANKNAENWWLAVRKCIAKQAFKLKKISVKLKDVGYVTVSGTSGTIVLVDKSLTPVTRPLMYDAVGFQIEAESILRESPQQDHISVGSNTVLARALKLQSEDVHKNAKYLLHQADFIMSLLRGKGGCTDKNNALKLGYDFENDRWPDWYSKTGLRAELLPKVFPVGHEIGNIAPRIAEEFGFSKETIICCGTTDSIAGFLACSPPIEGVAVTSLGTTLSIKLASTKKIEDPSIGLYSHPLNGLWLAGGASNSGAGVLKKFFSDDKLEMLSSQININSNSGLKYYPLREKGERFPFNDPNFRPSISPRPKDDVLFLQGLMEGIAQIEALCYQEIRSRGGPAITQLFTCGGGAKNKIWSLIRSKKLNLKITTPTNNEPAIGSALIPLLKLKA